MADPEEQDLVLKVTLNDIHRFMVVIAKESSIADLKAEIAKVSRLLLSSVDLGEITSVQSCCHHELPIIYKVGRLLKEGEGVLAYSTGHVSNYADSTLLVQNAMTLETSSQDLSQKTTQNRSDSTDSSKNFVRENRTSEFKDLATSGTGQECSSKRIENKDMDKTYNSCKDFGSRKGKTRTQDFELASSDVRQQCSNREKEKKTTNSADDTRKSSGCTKEKSRNQTHHLEISSNNKDGQNTDEIDEHESIEQCKGTKDKNNEGRSPERLTTENTEQNQETPVINDEEERQSMMQSQESGGKDILNNKMSKEILTDAKCNSKEKHMDVEQEDKESNSEVFIPRKANLRKTVFRKKDFILQSGEENCNSRSDDNRNEKSRQTAMRTRNRVFSTQIRLLSMSDSERIENTPCSKDLKELEKMSRRKRKRSRTQSIDESLVDENQRNRPAESASTGSQPSSIVSEAVLNSQEFKEMLETAGCFSQRRRQAIEKSVTKVATWLVDSDNKDDETPSIQRMSTELLDDPESSPANHCVPDSPNNNIKDKDSTHQVYYENIDRVYPIIDILSDRVLYYDSDPSDASTSGGQIKETYLSSCRVVIHKLDLTKQVILTGLKTCRDSEPQRIAPEVIPSRTNAAKRSVEGASSAELCMAGREDTNEEDCGYSSHGIIGSTGSEDLPVSPKLKHLTSYTNDPLPSNVNKPLEHHGNEKGEDNDSCCSTEILNSEEKALSDHPSLTNKLKLPPAVEGAIANETEENEEHHPQEVEKSQESCDRIMHDDTDSQELENEPTISEETVDKDPETTEYFSPARNYSSKKEEVGLSSPKKKKKKEKSLETGESMLTSSGDGDGSVLSEIGMNSTSSIEKHSQKDQMPKQRSKQDKEGSDDNRTEDDSEQSLSKRRKKKDDRNKMQEKISAVTEKTRGSESDDVNNNAANKQPNEKEHENSTNEEASTLRENSIKENSAKLPNIQTVILESTPRKETSVKERFANTRPSIKKSLVNLPNEGISVPEKLTKEKSKHLKKDNSKNKGLSQQTLDCASQHFNDAEDGSQTCGENTERTSKAKELDSVIEDNSFENKAEKKKKKKKKKKHKREISMEEMSEGEEKQKNKEMNECSVDKKISSSLESTESPEGKKKKREKDTRKRQYKDEKVDICEQDAAKKSSKTSKRSRREEFKASSKPVEQVDKPVLKSSTEKSDLDETGKDEERTHDKTKKESKRKEKMGNNEMNKEKKDRGCELQEEIPKKKYKKTRKVCEESGKTSQNGSHPPMFTSGSESEGNVGVTDVLSWISKKIKKEAPKKSSTKKTNKSTLLDLAQDDQELNTHNTPLHSAFTTKSLSMNSRSRLFLKTPIGFTNTVPRVPKKSNLTATTVTSSTRKRKRSTSPPQRRELTQEEKEMLSGGVKRLDELLEDDSFWE